MKRILVVDDSVVNLQFVDRALHNVYKLVLVKSGKEALHFLSHNTVDLVLLDVMMPDINGYDTFDQIRKTALNPNVPVIFLTADSDVDSEIRGLRMGAMDFIHKPYIAEIMINRINRILELEDFNKNLERKIEQKTIQLEKMTLETITTIASMIDAKDSYTKGHSERVAEYSIEIAKSLGLDQNSVEQIYNIALLHDIGKIGIPDSILTKTSRLEFEEYEVMKGHTTIGWRILQSINSIPNIAAGALYHHEKYDGTGYPKGLKGNEIPFIGRIISIADAFDAMTSNRSYRKMLSKERVMEEFEKGKGTQFDPQMVDVLFYLIKIGRIDFGEETS